MNNLAGIFKWQRTRRGRRRAIEKIESIDARRRDDPDFVFQRRGPAKPYHSFSIGERRPTTGPWLKKLGRTFRRRPRPVENGRFRIPWPGAAHGLAFYRLVTAATATLAGAANPAVHFPLFPFRIGGQHG